MADLFGAYSQYYDVLYQDKDYEGESAYVFATLRRFDSKCRTILELGCGTGRHADLMGKAGFQVTGVELSDSMLAHARERADSSGGSFEVHSGDARTFAIDKQFDAVISLFHVVSYQTTNKDARQMFANAARHLRPGGMFLFDVWYGPAVLTVQPNNRVKRMEDESVQVLRIAEPELDVNADTVTVNYTVLVTDKTTGGVTQFSEAHPMRYYFAPELELLASNCGLEIVHSEEWLTGAHPSDKTWGVCFLAQKTDTR